MSIRERVLETALRLCRSRRGWKFSPAEVVGALPDLNAASVRTHVMSRCCVNAPAHHAHRWPYFRRVRRGVYEVVPAYRSSPKRGRTSDATAASPTEAAFDIRERDTPDPVIEAYAKDVDRTQIRRNLARSPSERLAELQQWIEAMDEMQGAARRPRR